MKKVSEEIKDTVWALTPLELIILATALTGWKIFRKLIEPEEKSPG